MKDRVRQLRKSHSLSQTEMADKLGVSQSVISLIESGHSSLSLDLLKKFAAFFDVSCDWLIYGHENFLKVSAEEGFMPMIDRQAVAGYLQSYSNPEYLRSLSMYKIPGFETAENFGIFVAEGDHMEPTISHGDKLICQRQESITELRQGLIYVVVSSKGLVIRRVQTKAGNGQTFLQSDNQLYGEEAMPWDSLLAIWSVKSKLTGKFTDFGNRHSDRLNSMESEIGHLREKLNFMQEQLSREGSEVIK